MTKITDEEVDYIKELLSYDPDTGLFTWKKSRRGVKKGTIAGNKNDRGYIQIKVNYKFYKAHRLAFLFMNQELPNMVDHIDGVKDNNKWDNLRPCNKSENGGNSKIRSDNTSGYKGVSFNKKSKKWVSYLYINGRQVFLGRFDCPIEAHKEYCKAAKKYRGDFARFD